MHLSVTDATDAVASTSGRASPFQVICLVGFSFVAMPAFATDHGSDEPEICKSNRIQIASGKLNGLYYPVGTAICQFINYTCKNPVRCSVKPTEGSLQNLELLSEGKVDFGIVQGDVWNIYLDKNSAVSSLAKVTKLYDELFQVLVNRSGKIESFDDLLAATKGSDEAPTIYAGGQNSGHRATLLSVIDELKSGTHLAKEKLAAESQRFTLGERLCSDAAVSEKVDAIVVTIGAQSLLTTEIFETCGGKLLVLPVPEDAFGPNFEYVSAPRFLEGNSTEFESFQVEALLISKNGVSDAFKASLIENEKTFFRFINLAISKNNLDANQ